MEELEGFESILGTLILSKALYDIGRFDLVVNHFFDVLCWDDYYHNMLAVISLIFTGYEGDYIENDDCEIMSFGDEAISGYFIHAWEYGKKNNLHYSQNPYVSLAKDEVEKWLHVSTCSSWKLSAHVRSKKSAMKSRIFIFHYTSCGCNASGNIAYGLIQLYAWFASKNAEFETKAKAVPMMPAIIAGTGHQGVKAA